MFASKTVRRIVFPILAVVALCIIFYAIDLLDGATRPYEHYKMAPGGQWPLVLDYIEYLPIAWADYASFGVGCAGVFYILYVVIPMIVYDNAKSHGRNAVRWTTAFVVFTPVLAGIAYLMTWPREKR